MDFINVIFRTIFFYILIIVIFRLMGKKEIGQLSIQDLVISILMAELVAISIEKLEDPIMLTVLPIIVLLIFELLFAFISVKSNKFRNIMEGKPSLIIDKGVVNFNEMIKQRYTLDDLLLELRRKNIKTINDVEYAILENDGTLSIFKYNFLRLNSSNPFPIILDGVIQKDTIKYLKMSCEDVKKLIKEKNMELRDIFYAFYMGKELFVIRKNQVK